MTTATKTQLADYARAQRHLGRRDMVLKRLIKAYGPCMLRHDADGFGVLCRSIVAQQISTKAAASITGRLMAGLGKKGLTPRAIAKASEAMLQEAGLSGGKRKSLRDLADKVLG